jgi:hypothetical protein
MAKIVIANQERRVNQRVDAEIAQRRCSAAHEVTSSLTDLGETSQFGERIGRDRHIRISIELDKCALVANIDDKNPAFFPRIRSDAVSRSEDNSS